MGDFAFQHLLLASRKHPEDWGGSRVAHCPCPQASLASCATIQKPQLEWSESSSRRPPCLGQPGTAATAGSSHLLAPKGKPCWRGGKLPGLRKEVPRAGWVDSYLLQRLKKVHDICHSTICQQGGRRGEETATTPAVPVASPAALFFNY